LYSQLTCTAHRSHYSGWRAVNMSRPHG